MELLSKAKTGKVERPVKVLQFGEGNFLRAFVDYMIDITNESGAFGGDIVLVKPIEFGNLDRFHAQECQYTVQLRGIVDGEAKKINRVITSVTDAVDAYGEYEKYAAYAKLDTLRFTDNQKPYKQRKVRILNGAHTSFVLASYLCGNDIVLESMNDALILNFIKGTLFDEVIPTLTLPKQDLLDFAEAVLTRFSNPYVKHAHLSISLNSVSKWRARCMPSFLDYIKNEGKLPVHLPFSLAALMAFYTGTEIRDKALIGHRGEEEYQILDDAAVLEFFAANSGKDAKEYAAAVLSNVDFWGQDLTALCGVLDAVASYLADIRALGMRAAMEKIFN